MIHSWRTLIVCETTILICLIVLLCGLLVYAMLHDGIGVGWFGLFIATAGTMGETVRRFRHLRTDLRAGNKQ